MSAPYLVIAAGGTGGHMFPAQALAEAMLRRGWRVRLSTDARGARYTGGFPHSTEITEVQSATFARGGALGRAMVVPKIALGVARTAWDMYRDRPDVVVGFGGYPSIPALGAATLLKLPRMIHEQNGVLGRVNQIFAPRVAAVACGVWPTALPEGAEGIHVGNPVRAAVLERQGASYITPGDYPMSLLVIGGSQGARILSDVVPQAIALLPEPMRANLRVAQQARPEDLDRVSAAYAELDVRADVQAFFTDIPRRMSEAQLVISRAGDHQTANARGLVEAGAAIKIPESALDPSTLAAQIETILANPAGAAQMSRAAMAVGAPDATERLVALVEELAQREPA